MAASKLPTNGGLFINLVKKMIAGIIQLGPSVPVTLVTAEEMQGQLDPFVEKNEEYNSARSTRQTASDAYQSAIGKVYTWLLAARLALMPKLGARWSTVWAQAGFINASTAIPRKIADQLALIVSLKGFFTKNPSYESPNTGVTAAQATILIGAVEQAQKNLTDEDMAFDDAGTAWTLAYDPLADSATSLIKNLEAKLGPFDPRWLGFGLQMPGAIATPEKPTGLSAHLDETGKIILQCDALALATRLRWRGLIVGMEVDYRLVASTTQPLASVGKVMPGQTMQFAVQGVNENLQGVLSDPVRFTMPLAAKMPEAGDVKPEAAGRKTSEVRVVNGKSNGNGHRKLVHS